jgi:hypothetical protein
MTEKTADNTSLEGLWKSFYRYPSSGRGNDAMWGRHTLRATQTDDGLHFESVPDSKSHVVIDIAPAQSSSSPRADVLNNAWSGTWREETEPNGYYKGAMYEGTIEFIVAADRQRLNGTWHGKGKNGEINKDVWELTRDGVAAAAGSGADSPADTNNDKA